MTVAYDVIAVYVALAIWAGFLVAGMKTKNYWPFLGFGLLLALALNVRYFIEGPPSAIAFFVGIYDVFDNIGLGRTEGVEVGPDGRIYATSVRDGTVVVFEKGKLVRRIGGSGSGRTEYAAPHDIAFAPGQYRPATAGGDRLLGHELAHVVQQREGGYTRIDREDDGSPTPVVGESVRVVGPFDNGTYRDQRLSLAIDPSGATSAGGGLWFHPSLPYLRERYLQGDVAVFPAVGEPTNDRSHFSSTTTR